MNQSLMPLHPGRRVQLWVPFPPAARRVVCMPVWSINFGFHFTHFRSGELDHGDAPARQNLDIACPDGLGGRQ